MWWRQITSPTVRKRELSLNTGFTAWKDNFLSISELPTLQPISYLQDSSAVVFAEKNYHLQNFTLLA